MLDFMLSFFSSYIIRNYEWVSKKIVKTILSTPPPLPNLLVRKLVEKKQEKIVPYDGLRSQGCCDCYCIAAKTMNFDL